QRIRGEEHMPPGDQYPVNEPGPFIEEFRDLFELPGSQHGEPREGCPDRSSDLRGYPPDPAPPLPHLFKLPMLELQDTEWRVRDHGMDGIALPPLHPAEAVLVNELV